MITGILDSSTRRLNDWKDLHSIASFSDIVQCWARISARRQLKIFSKIDAILVAAAGIRRGCLSRTVEVSGEIMTERSHSHGC